MADGLSFEEKLTRYLYTATHTNIYAAGRTPPFNEKTVGQTCTKHINNEAIVFFDQWSFFEPAASYI
jgi:hypothetical protein